jgi:hypothetical protein
VPEPCRSGSKPARLRSLASGFEASKPRRPQLRPRGLVEASNKASRPQASRPEIEASRPRRGLTRPQQASDRPRGLTRPARGLEASKRGLEASAGLKIRPQGLEASAGLARPARSLRRLRASSLSEPCRLAQGSQGSKPQNRLQKADLKSKPEGSSLQAAGFKTGFKWLDQPKRQQA